MKTEITDSPEAAARFIKGGGIVAFPTETVYGLGADVFNEAAIAKIFEAKRRPADNPLIAHVAGVEQIEQLASHIPYNAALLIREFFPGPLTVVLESSKKVPLIATAGLETVGVRMPGSTLANRFLAECGTPVVAPSANLSGRPSPTTWEAVLEDLDGRIDCILRGEPTDIGLESTVLDCTVNPPTVLRSGAVTVEQLRSIVPSVRVNDEADQAAPRSPGMRHKHYSPRAAVQLIDNAVDAETHAGFIGLQPLVHVAGPVLICGSVEEYARKLFEFFRECDRAGVSTIYCQTVPETGIGVALMDRLRRAAAG